MRYAGVSHKGLIRQTNQDNYKIMDFRDENIPIIVLIADGMGGHNSGELASRLAVDYASRYVSQHLDKIGMESSYPEILINAMEEANSYVYSKSLEDIANIGMGTTLIMAAIFPQRVYIGHIGDSRVYQINDKGIQRITTDHSLIEELLRSGSISISEAENHPKKHIITKALGCTEEIQIDTYVTEIFKGDVIVFCTDGLTNMVSEKEIYQKVKSDGNPADVCNALLALANEKGGKDNITVITVFI